MADFVSNFNPFPRQHLGMGATWSSREQLESITRAANMTLASSNGAAISRTPSGPILDIYGLRLFNIRNRTSTWNFSAFADEFALSDVLIDGDLPKTTTTNTFDLFLRRFSNDDVNEYSGKKIMLCSNNPDFTGIQFTDQRFYYNNIPRSELYRPGLSGKSFLWFAECTISGGNLSVSLKCSPYFIHAWCQAPEIGGGTDSGIYWRHTTSGTKFSIIANNIDSNSRQSIASPLYSSDHEGYLTFSTANPTEIFIGSSPSARSFAKVKIVDGWLIYFKYMPLFNIPSESAATGTVTAGQTTNYGIIQN